MVHHQNQNGFTWKRTKETPCITVRYTFFKVSEDAENMSARSWFFYFDEKPDLSSFKDTLLQVPVTKLLITTTGDCTSSQTARAFPAFSISGKIGQGFMQWLTRSGGGCKKERAAQSKGFCRKIKNSSAVARVHYQKQRSREVATKVHECLQKLQGAKGFG